MNYDNRSVLARIYDPERQRVTAQHGDRFKTVYTPVLDNENRLSVVAAGKDDLYAEIQSHKDSVDINTILSRYNAGDTSVLHKGDMLYMDVTQMPKTYAEMYERVMQAQELFDRLPLEVRAHYEHNPARFFAAIGTPDFEFAAKYVAPEPVVDTPAPVQEGENSNE